VAARAPPPSPLPPASSEEDEEDSIAEIEESQEMYVLFTVSLYMIHSFFLSTSSLFLTTDCQLCSHIPSQRGRPVSSCDS
jgi:hypothetical protein